MADLVITPLQMQKLDPGSFSVEHQDAYHCTSDVDVAADNLVLVVLIGLATR